MDENIVLSRISIRHPSVLSDGSSLEDEGEKSSINHDERKWRLSYLKAQFESLELHELFKTYTGKIYHGYFSLFLIVQSIISLIHFLVVVTSKHEIKEDSMTIFPDLILYFTTFVLSLVGLRVVDRVAEEYHTIRGLSICAFLLLLFSNIFLPIFHYDEQEIKFRPAYTPYLILSCYMFFGTRKRISFLMALAVTVSDLIIVCFITYKDVVIYWKVVSSDVVFLMAVNGLGIYFRNMSEIIVRRSFLDRRDFIMSKLQLRHEEEQTETLMGSIIPTYVISKVKKNYIEATAYYRKYNKHLLRSPFDNSLLDEHDNVSILFADIVHYTEMTIKLDITDLIETLNELFTSFDDSSAKLNVSRIKFLGDCYYCVAGLPPNPAKNHAEACVDLGLDMITIIANIRRKRNLKINMRIGIHSGKIISGIIGSVKYQFDIWSKAVDIANKMESEGISGKVHITNKTKDLLEKEYNIIQTDKGSTVPQFRQNNLQTYLISPQSAEESESANTPRPSKFKKQKSNGILLNHLHRVYSVTEDLDDKKDDSDSSIDNNIEDANRGSNTSSTYKRRYANNATRVSKSGERRSIVDAKRRTAFMNNNLKRYAERTQTVNEEMAETIKITSFSKYRQYTSHIKDINALLLFNNFKDEIEYITLPDPLFKYYLLASLALIACIYLIQNLTLNYWELRIYSLWPYLATVGFICFVFLPLSFSQVVWNNYLTRFAEKAPSNSVVKMFRKISGFITGHFIVRFMIFSLLYMLFVWGFWAEAGDCAADITDLNYKSIDSTHFLKFVTTRAPYKRCVIPWQMTHTCMLVLFMPFMFLRMFLWIKLTFAVILMVWHSYAVLQFSDEFYKQSETFNYTVTPEVAHILSIICITFSLHTLDRQTDYMNRLNHLLNKKVKKEQEEANELQFVNENLLLNILPKHVASLYLDVNRKMEELYYEEHSETAVMFASIITDDLQEILDEKSFLTLMNDYITSFDTLINRAEYKNVEKIKIAKWTYMAACGLFPTDKENEFERHVTSTSLDILLNFASDMFKKLDYVNRSQYQTCKLRIGICHGSIVAGVVGSKKPLYDIWGDPVNMASRMDSTGEPNQIQIMEDTADIIQRLGYVCEYRDKIHVKGRKGLVTTYFVVLDDEFNLIKVTPS